MASKGKAAKAGAVSVGQSVRDNEYLQRLVEDEDLRDNLRTAFDSGKKAYARMSNGKGPAKALFDDKKTQRELQTAAENLKEAADALRGGRPKKKRRGSFLLLLIVGAGAALFKSEDLRKKALDLLCGAEEEFEYTSTTTPQTAAPPPPPSPPPVSTA